MDNLGKCRGLGRNAVYNQNVLVLRCCCQGALAGLQAAGDDYQGYTGGDGRNGEARYIETRRHTGGNGRRDGMVYKHGVPDKLASILQHFQRASLRTIHSLHVSASALTDISKFNFRPALNRCRNCRQSFLGGGWPRHFLITRCRVKAWQSFMVDRDSTPGSCLAPEGIVETRMAEGKRIVEFHGPHRLVSRM
jgi:hypothetical protein